MKFLSGLLAALFLAAVSPVAAQAQQTRTGIYLQTTVTFDPAFLQSAQSSGITIIDDSGLPLQNGADTFTTTILSPIDLATGANEIITSGGYRVIIGSTTYRIIDFIFTRTSVSTANISAYFIVNNRALGRFPLFVVTGPSLDVPLTPPPNNVVPSNGLTLSFAPDTAGPFNGIEPGAQIATLQIVGILNPNGS